MPEQDRPYTSAWVRGYFGILCTALVALNGLTFIYHATAIGLFNALSVGVGVVLVAYSLIVSILCTDSSHSAKNFLLMALIFATISALFNMTSLVLSDFIKYISVYVFYAAGRSDRSPIRGFEKFSLLVLFALPIVFMAIGKSKVYEIEIALRGHQEAIGYIYNQNTAVLYYCSILFAAAPMLGRYAIVLQLINAAVMTKIGAILATLLAVTLWIAVPVRKESVLAGIFIAFVCVAAFSLGAFDRVIAALDNLSLVFSMQPQALVSMPYRDLVELTGSTDLSSFFRLIHWSNIWDVFVSNPANWLVGYGPGQTITLTYSALAPHNDYLRVLAEYGLPSLIVFVCFLYHVWKSLGNGPERVLFLVLCVYFFSENLIESFSSMGLFFAYAGRTTRRLGAEPAREYGARARRGDEPAGHGAGGLLPDGPEPALVATPTPRP
ncbi:O-antigen polymerase [Methylobacterium sp. 4-46]|uniref:O-antigen ligase family protein n=1 Tax=unclassified Methylobacterium TaxID=2615210 RepID=UPI000152D615|nr:MULTISPECIES: O-antigen ligase family protein [Methylobacterium]ACA19312.1 O-antigen polymerase [Methylobacterium sp. 4-46]WFT78515.1 O-antigen ligase family protein [Methylobacterium nodulans]